MGLRKYQKKKYQINVFFDSIIHAYEKYYPQIFLEECKHAKENIKTKNYIDGELKSKSESDIDTDTKSDSYNDIDIDIEEQIR